MPTINGRYITKTQLREMLKAVRDLKRKYEYKKQLSKYAGDLQSEFVTKRCPLCAYAKIDDSYELNCSICPWMIFEEYLCTEARYYCQPIPDRIARCDRWITRILEELAK